MFAACRSLTQALTIVIQTALDAGATYGAFSLAGFLGAAENIPLHNVWGFGATVLGSYFGAAAVLCACDVRASLACIASVQPPCRQRTFLLCQLHSRDVLLQSTPRMSDDNTNITNDLRRQST